MSRLVGSVAKATQILGTFNRMNRVLTIRDIAAKTGIPRSTVHDICTTLVAANFLESRPEGGFQLGLSLAMLGGQVIEQQGIVDSAQAPIQRHIDRFGVEVHVAIFIPGAVFYAYRKRAVTRVETMNRTGRRSALHASACGRAVLAAMPPAAREEELAPFLSPEETTKFEAELRQLFRYGYLVTDVSQQGFTSIAAPIIDDTGLAVGAIGVADLTRVMSPRRVQEIGEAVRLAAFETSQALGWKGQLSDMLKSTYDS